jgi:hypothetical protein
MKHYLSYDITGKLVGIHTHAHAGTKLGGWPDDCRLDNPNCPNPTSKWFRENIIGQNGVVGFIACECECSPTERDCTCASEDFASKRVVGGVLVSKLEGALLKSGAIIQNKATLRAAPGSKLSMKIACVGVVDGSKLDVYQKGQVMVLETNPVTLTFTGGETEVFEVTAPAQGITGAIAVVSKDVIPISVSVVGWA